MVTWICRFMILVFAYNIFIPEVVYAQTNQKSSNVQNPVEARLRAAYYATALPVQNWGLVPGTLPATSLEALNEEYGRQMNDLANTYDTLEIKSPVEFLELGQIVAQLHQLANEYTRIKKMHGWEEAAPAPDPAAQIDWNQVQQELRQPLKTSPNTSATHPEFQKLFMPSQSEALQTFFIQLAKDELSLSDLTEYLDPLITPQREANDAFFQADYQLTAFVAQFFSDQLTKILQDTASVSSVNEEFRAFLPRLQQRALYRLKHLPKDDSYALIMARSELRILLYQIHRFLGEEDFLGMMYTQTQSQSNRFAVVPSRAVYQKYKQNQAKAQPARQAEGKSGSLVPPLTYEEFCEQYTQMFDRAEDIPAQLPAGFEIQTRPFMYAETATSPNSQLYDNFLMDFTRELKQLKDKAQNPRSGAEPLLTQQAEYTATYVMLIRRPQHILTLVKMFEAETKTDVLGRVRPTPFDTPFANVISTILLAAKEASIGEDILPVLTELAEPSHNTQTRIVALQLISGELSQKLEDQTRNRLARYTVDLYYPLTDTGYKLDGYGLDSNQMRVLADSLTRIVNDLTPITAPDTVWSEPYNRYVPDTTKTILLQHRKESDDAPYFDPQTGKSMPKPTYVFGTDGRAHPLYFQNALNWRAVDAENGKMFARLAGETVAWAILLGPVVGLAFRVIGRSVRTVGFVPQAFNVARKAQGLSAKSRIGRFSAKMRQGWKYSKNINHTLSERGMTISTTRLEKTKTPASASDPKVKSEEIFVTRSGTSYVFGRANTKEAPGFGKRLSNFMMNEVPSVERYTIEIRRPGFQNTSTGFTSDILKGSSLKSPLGKARMYRAISSYSRSAEGAARAFRINPLTASCRKIFPNTLVAREEQLMDALRTSLREDLEASKAASGATGSVRGIQNNAFEYWGLNQETKAWKQLTPEEFQQRLGELFAEAQQSKQASTLPEKFKDYYSMLDVRPDASAKEITKAYRKKAFEWHPDHQEMKTPAEQLLAEETFKDLAEGYKILGNPETRALYDTKFFAWKGKPVVSPKAAPGAPQGVTQNMPKKGTELALNSAPEISSSPVLAIRPNTHTWWGEPRVRRLRKSNARTGWWQRSGEFNPVEELGAMGISHDNVTIDLADQLAKHIRASHSWESLNGLPLLKRNSIFNNLKSTFVFFAAWDMLDRISYAFQQPILKKAGTRQMNEEYSLHKDVFNPSAAAQSSESSFISDKVHAARSTEGDQAGALFTAPFLAPRAKRGLLDLVGDQTRTDIAHAANRARFQIAQGINSQNATAKIAETWWDPVQIQQTLVNIDLHLAAIEPTLSTATAETVDFYRYLSREKVRLQQLKNQTLAPQTKAQPQQPPFMGSMPTADFPTLESMRTSKKSWWEKLWDEASHKLNFYAKKNLQVTDFLKEGSRKANLSYIATQKQQLQESLGEIHQIGQSVSRPTQKTLYGTRKVWNGDWSVNQYLYLAALHTTTLHQLDQDAQKVDEEKAEQHILQYSQKLSQCLSFETNLTTPDAWKAFPAKDILAQQQNLVSMLRENIGQYNPSEQVFLTVSYDQILSRIQAVSKQPQNAKTYEELVHINWEIARTLENAQSLEEDEVWQELPAQKVQEARRALSREWETFVNQLASTGEMAYFAENWSLAPTVLKEVQQEIKDLWNNPRLSLAEVERKYQQALVKPNALYIQEAILQRRTGLLKMEPLPYVYLTARYNTISRKTAQAAKEKDIQAVQDQWDAYNYLNYFIIDLISTEEGWEQLDEQEVLKIRTSEEATNVWRTKNEARLDLLRKLYSSPEAEARIKDARQKLNKLWTDTSVTLLEVEELRSSIFEQLASTLRDAARAHKQTPHNQKSSTTSSLSAQDVYDELLGGWDE